MVISCYLYLNTQANLSELCASMYGLQGGLNAERVAFYNWLTVGLYAVSRRRQQSAGKQGNFDALLFSVKLQRTADSCLFLKMV